ncbi:MAG: SpoIIE family protein phosphatase, partial [Acidobacteriaceae bacterium]
SDTARASDIAPTSALKARIALDLAARLSLPGNNPNLAPYRNGEEVQLESGLPLGIAAGVEYAEVSFAINPRDRLTFLSDGVVEAQSSSGELFGFDHTRAISGQSAEDIARAAQHFGQQDDITVLTLTFAGVEAVHV